MTVDRTKNNVVAGRFRHAVSCPYIQSDAHDACDCHPLDDSRAMRSEDVLSIFAPLPIEELGIFDYI